MSSSSKTDHEHTAPLLEQEAYDRSSQDIELAHLDGRLSRSSTETFRHDPPVPAVPKTKSSYLAIAGALLLTVAGFTVNTESTAYIEDVLGWRKPFCTMYITHSCLCLPWVAHLMFLRYKDRKMPYKAWVRDYNNTLREAITSIDAYASSGSYYIIKRKGNVGGPLDFLATTMSMVTVVLTVSGCSWFLALAMTTPADLTAIYNCSTFFAATFSVPLLREKLGWVTMVAVALAIIGTFIIAYGDSTSEHDASEIGSARVVGNLVACIGAVAFGLYEVLFKKWACSSRPMAPSASLPLTFAASALTGLYTFATLWIGLVVLHFTGIEEFVWPSGKVALWLLLSVLSGSIAINLLVVLVIWTDPVFGSMANVLSVFFVALGDRVVFNLSPSTATYLGGAIIIIAFALLAKDTLGEKKH
ncbi:hypothetical protein LTR37_012603 [Vermiconidia calcicola]|uniref:Uncharacterized protein n=1 Tax=Vermiconidia calcicola TaxID=1690605 RepID=A0ACC3MZA3_9PEZI|nr:hypothetical protein LTR37_012603 [Vermiconidia calcicola]